MPVVLATAVGLILWVVLWSIGAKGFDGGMLFLIVVLIGATIKGVGALLPGNRKQDDIAPDPAPFT